MKIVILAAFPIHFLPGVDPKPAIPGYYATWFCQLAKAFAKETKFQFHWIVLTREVERAQKIVWNAQTFYILPAGSKGSRATTFFHRDRKEINALLDEIAPDVVHGWGSEDVYGLAAVLSGRSSIVSMQGILSYYCLKNKMHPRDYFQAMLEVFILWKADLITVESEWGRRLLKKRSPIAKIELVEYGAEDYFFNLDWRPKADLPTVIFVGTVGPRKGVHDLVAAFASPSLQHARLQIIGGGESTWIEELKAVSSPNVEWLGRRSHEEIATRMREAWAFALPTRADTSPNVVKEARIIGLPVITTPCGGQTTYIKNGESGFIVNPGDIPALTQALLTLTSDFALCRRMGATLHAEHRALLHPDKTAKSFLTLYRKMVEKTVA